MPLSTGAGSAGAEVSAGSSGGAAFSVPAAAAGVSVFAGGGAAGISVDAAIGCSSLAGPKAGTVGGASIERSGGIVAASVDGSAAGQSDAAGMAAVVVGVPGSPAGLASVAEMDRDSFMAETYLRGRPGWRKASPNLGSSACRSIEPLLWSRGICGLTLAGHPPYSAALSSAGPPTRNCSSNAASSALAAVSCRCLTCPNPRIFSGIAARPTAR
jgi:hypothetical protein